MSSIYFLLNHDEEESSVSSGSNYTDIREKGYNEVVTAPNLGYQGAISSYPSSNVYIGRPTTSSHNIKAPATYESRSSTTHKKNDKNLISLAIRRKQAVNPSLRTSSSTRAAPLPPTSIKPHNALNIQSLLISERHGPFHHARTPSPEQQPSSPKIIKVTSRIRLVLAPSLLMLYYALTPSAIRRKIRIMHNGPKGFQERFFELNRKDMKKAFTSSLQIAFIRLVDREIFDLNRRTSSESDTITMPDAPIFKTVDSAVESVFDLKEYTCVRVTRAAATEPEGTSLLKLETATPGEEWLLDDDEYNENIYECLGKKGDKPNILFIKKVVARPRYKANMRIYIIPKNICASIYTQERMLERDLVNGVVDLNYPNRSILCAFDYNKVLSDYRKSYKS